MSGSSSDEERSAPASPVSSPPTSSSRTSLEERFIQQHNLRPQYPTVRIPRPPAISQSPTISSRHPPGSGAPPPPPAPPAPYLMTPWLGDNPPMGWAPGAFQPWLTPSQADVNKYMSSFPASSSSRPQFASPSSSSSSSAFTRPGLSSQGPRDFLPERPVLAPFERPSGGPSSSVSFIAGGPVGQPTQILHAQPEPGEVTIEKSEPWPASPAPSLSSSTASRGPALTSSSATATRYCNIINKYHYHSLYKKLYNLSNIVSMILLF